MRTNTIRRNRTACSILALATAMVVGASPAAAQSFDAVPIGTPINATVTTGTNSTTVTITGQQAVINWNPTGQLTADGRIFSLPGTTATFTGTQNFAVLNNIVSTNNPSVFLGTVQSLVNGQTGGTVYFYNGNGIVVGSGGAFNVGSLGLTTIPIGYNATTGAWVSGFGTAAPTVVFDPNQPPPMNSGVGGTITTRAGSLIETLNTNGYVAMVAPRVVHNGTITTNGQAALVGAEAATITFSPDGLFDITVDVGTTDANGVVIGGSIGGQASTGLGDHNRIYAVAVPKNQAMTLAITGGTIGFDVAGRADVVGNAIVLSAGHNITDGQVDIAPAAAGGSGEARVSGQNFTASSALTMVGKTDAEIIATTNRTMHSDVTLRATREARIVSSGASGNLTIRGNVSISADVDVATGATGSGGIASLYTLGGLLTVEGNVSMSAFAYGADSFTGGVSGGSATGGTVGISASDGGTVTILGSASLSADGEGGEGRVAGTDGGSGTGGNVNVGTFGVGSDVIIGGNLSASADGYGGFVGCSSCTGLGGLGQGGLVYVGATNDSDGSTVRIGNFESFISLSADGYGGGSAGGASGATGAGGTVYVWSQGNASDVALRGDLSASALGWGGSAQGPGVNGGLGDGGNIYVLAHLPDSSLSVTGTSFLSAEGRGGDSGGEGCFSCNGLGGNAVGGEVAITTSSIGPGATMSFGGLVTAEAGARGGEGVAGGGNAIGGGASGSGSQGISATFAANTDIAFSGGVNFSAIGRGGVGTDGNGGDGTGGRVRIGSQTGATGGTLTVIGNSVADVSGYGGDAFNAGTGGTGQGGMTDNGGSAGTVNFQGNFSGFARGTGGTSAFGTGGQGRGGRGWVDAFGATITIGGNYSMDAGATGGNGATGGSALGGGASGNPGGAQLVSTSNLSVGGTALVAANATGGFGNSGNGGSATGGFATIRAEGVGKNLTVTGNATVEARADGGGSTALGGNAQGGFARVLAFVGGNIDLLGLTRVSSDAVAVNSGDGRGGTSQVFAGNASSIDLNQLNLRADGYGGDDTGLEAGDGYGGTATLESNGPGSSVTVANNITTGNLQDREMLSADGIGGITNGNGGPEGGDGTGGTVNLRATAGGTVNLATNATGTNNILIRARGYGGNANADNTIAGEAFGGTLNLLVDGGTMSTGFLQYSSIGFGGTATNAAVTAGFNITGGEGFGGNRNITVTNGTLTTAIVGGVSGGVGGNGIGTGNGGNASGGTASLIVTNSTLNGIGNIGITTQVYGGEAAGTGNGGNASGPNTVNVNITNSTINMASGSTLGFYATSYGGPSQGGVGGSATAGTASASISGSAVNGGNLVLQAFAQSFNGLTGGGSATGGTAILNLAGSTLGLEGLLIAAGGFGASSASGTAGTGTGGTARLNSSGASSTITLSGGTLQVLADGFGGNITGSGGTAGNGNGGLAEIFAASGTTLTVNGATSLAATGIAGNSAGSGSGGAADGGTAAIFTNGTVNLNGNTTLTAAATGGNASAGAGGSALGGTARVGTVGGLVAIGGTLSLDGSASGGSGLSGGNATALVSPTSNEESPTAASLFVNGGGAITISGATAINASATGGAGSSGNGGNASAGEIDVVPYVGDITLAGLTINANGTGGAGGQGGNGGFGAGGVVDVAFGLNAAPIDATMTVGTAVIEANGLGGAGGQGIDANSGGNGGSGGDGTGGNIAFSGSAAGGALGAGNVTLSASGTGGAGGAGGQGDAGIGGNGGAGGVGTGGFIQAGTISNQNSPGVGGDFDVGDLSINTSAFGGVGGNGGLSGGGNGAGGHGGNAFGGASYFLIRGVAASADAVTLFASATGGNGGTGSTAGNGGNAKTGLLAVESKDRFGHPTQRGSLVADSVTATAIATGGTGAINGLSTILGGSYFRVLNGDANIGSVSFTISGDLYDDSVYSDYVSVRDGVATIGSFSYSTTEALALDASNGSMNASAINLSAGSFRANRADVPAPTAVGSYNAVNMTITTGGDFITNANLTAGASDLVIQTSGQIQAANLTATSGRLILGANAGPITAGNLSSGSFLTVQSNGAMTLGNVSAGNDTLLGSIGNLTTLNVTSSGGLQMNSGGNLSAQDVTAVLGFASRVTGTASFADIDALSVSAGALGALTFATATADQTVRLGSETSIAGGTVTAGNSIVATAAGPIALGNLSAGLVNPVSGGLHEVALVTSGMITTGTIAAAGDVQLAATGGITTGNVSTTDRMFAVSPGVIALGAVTTGDYLLVGGTGLFAFTGSLDIDGSGFDARPTFANFGGPGAASVTTGALNTGRIEIGAAGNITTGAIDSSGSTRLRSTSGNVLVGGNLTADAFIALIGATVTTGALTSLSNIFVSSPGAVSTGAIDSGLWVGVTGGSIDVAGTIDAATYVSLSSSGDIDVSGTVDAGTNVTMSASGASATIDAANITAGGNVLLNAATILAGDISALGFISLFAGGPATISVGDLSGNGIYASSLGNVTTGDLVSTDDVAIASLEGAITTGTITAATEVDLDAAGNITFGNVSADDFNFESGGTVQGGNIVATTHADGHADGALTVQNVTVSGPPAEDDFSVGFTSLTSIQVGNVSGFGNVGFATVGNLTTGNLSAGNLVMALVGGNVVTGSITTSASGEVYIANVSMFETGGGSLDPDVEADFDENIVLALAPVATGGSLTINGATDTPVFRAAIGTAFAIGDISVEGDFAVSAASITTGDVTATDSIGLTASGAIVTGDLTAGTSVTLIGGSVSTGDILAGVGAPVITEGFTTMDVGPGESVEIFSDGSIVTGDITTDGYVGLYAEDNITAASINAEHDIIALAGGNASFGPITTPERFILAGYSNFDELGSGQNFNPELIFGLFPIGSTGGTATFAGSSNVGDEFTVYAGGNVVLASLTVAGGEFNSGFIGIDAGGTIGISGTVQSDYIDLVSRDINIAATAQITTRGISFNSINPNGTYIGDNLPGTDGYRLTQAEIDRVDSTFYGFDVLPGRGAAEMMMIGDLTLDLSGGGAEDDDEGADFEIESDDEGQEEDELRGIIRIVGDVNLISSTDKTVYFTAETVAIDAATGSLSLTNGSGQLNGLIEFEANNIFVASGAIIDKLIANPRYAGYVEELNAPAAVQRPEGVLRAGAIIFNDEAALENLAIQNTGTASTPAGFVVLSESAYYDEEVDDGDDDGEFPPTGSISLVINGQIQTPTGMLTGVAVRDALVTEYGSTEPFTENSTINGCSLTGSCGGTVVPPTAVVNPTQVAILTSDPLGESTFGNEGDIAGESGDSGEGESDDGGSASNPIDAPQPLFDTRPLDGDEDLNEPVSGAGNPSLYGISSDEDDSSDDDEDEEEKKKRKTGAAKPAGATNARTGDGQ